MISRTYQLIYQLLLELY